MFFEVFIGPYILRLAESTFEDVNTSEKVDIVKNKTERHGNDDVFDKVVCLPTQSSTNGRRKRIRKVSFAQHEVCYEDENDYSSHTSADVTQSANDEDEDLWRSSLWWTDDEYAEIHNSIRRISKELQDRGYSGFLENALNSYSGRQRRAKNFDMDDEAKSALLQWCTFGHSRRGLEKRSNSKHCLDRDICRTNSRRIVLDAQRKISLTEEDLAEIYRGATKPSKKFALMMGHADAMAVGNSFAATQSRCALLLGNLMNKSISSQ